MASLGSSARFCKMKINIGQGIYNSSRVLPQHARGSRTISSSARTNHSTEKLMYSEAHFTSCQKGTQKSGNLLTHSLFTRVYVDDIVPTDEGNDSSGIFIFLFHLIFEL